MADLSLRNVWKRFGSVEVIRDVGFDIADGEFVVFVGPSGCGKSTLLRHDLRARERQRAARCCIDGTVVNDVPAARRGLALVFQSYALYPHMTRLSEHGVRAGESRHAEAGDRGARRRGGADAAARAIICSASRRRSPAGSASASRSAARSCASRASSCSTSRSPTSTRSCASGCAPSSRSCTGGCGTTMIYVTHDQVEAMTMADRIVVLRARHRRAGRAAARTVQPRRRTSSSPASSARRG